MTMAGKKRTAPPLHWSQANPLLEWVAASLGLALSMGAIGFVAWDGAQHDDRPPEVTVSVSRIAPTAGGYLVEIEARNRSRETAAGVEVEGSLANGEASTVQFDYVPGLGRRQGGLVFREDPRGSGLELRVKGHSIP